MMIRKKIFSLSFLLLTFLIMAPTFAGAEWFLDLYGGIAKTPDSDVTADVFAYPNPSESTTRKLSFDNSFTIGVRGGKWTDSWPWLGWALDLSYFGIKQGEEAQVSVVPLSVLGMFRYPLLKSSDYPGGRLQPYVGLGMGFFFYNASVDFRPAAYKELSDRGYVPGFDGRAGLAWQFHRHLGLLVEYRFTYFEIDHSYSAEGMEMNLGTHHGLLGIFYRF